MSLLVKLLVVLLLLAIFISLFCSLYFMVKDKGQTKRTVNGLTVRIALSVFAFLLLMAAYLGGIISPHGVQPTHQQIESSQ